MVTPAPDPLQESLTLPSSSTCDSSAGSALDEAASSPASRGERSRGFPGSSLLTVFAPRPTRRGDCCSGPRLLRLWLQGKNPWSSTFEVVVQQCRLACAPLHVAFHRCTRVAWHSILSSSGSFRSTFDKFRLTSTARKTRACGFCSRVLPTTAVRLCPSRRQRHPLRRTRCDGPKSR